MRSAGKESMRCGPARDHPESPDRIWSLKSLGEGGTGAVYKARDREIDRMVAVKVIRPELARNADILSASNES